THYECVRNIGITCRELIHKRIEDDRAHLTPLFSFIHTTDGHQLHQSFIDIICRMFPWYWNDIRGLADD
ncbi:unnamed protein product, partial [Rotaria sp. Silwood2]